MSVSSDADLFTTVENVSGQTMKFSFIPPHGVTLAPNATYTIYGLWQHALGVGMQSIRKKRSIANALETGLIAILSTPRPFFYDASAAAALANPTVAATATATGGGSSGGSLGAGSYAVAYTFVNSWGETTVGTSESATLTISAGNKPQVTFPSLPSGATSINLYCTAETSGTPDPTTYRLYASGISSTTYSMLIALPTLGVGNPAPPIANTTKAHTVRGINVSNNTLGLVDPSWGSFTG